LLSANKDAVFSITISNRILTNLLSEQLKFLQ
jgi:hypothetical protein